MMHGTMNIKYFDRLMMYFLAYIKWILIWNEEDFFFYLDETWKNSNLKLKKCWQTDEVRNILAEGIVGNRLPFMLDQKMALLRVLRLFKRQDRWTVTTMTRRTALIMRSGYQKNWSQIYFFFIMRHSIVCKSTYLQANKYDFLASETKGCPRWNSNCTCKVSWKCQRKWHTGMIMFSKYERSLNL